MKKELVNLWLEYKQEVEGTVHQYPTEFNQGDPTKHLNFLHFMDWLIRKQVIEDHPRIEEFITKK